MAFGKTVGIIAGIGFGIAVTFASCVEGIRDTMVNEPDNNEGKTQQLFRSSAESAAKNVISSVKGVVNVVSEEYESSELPQIFSLDDECDGPNSYRIKECFKIEP